MVWGHQYLQLSSRKVVDTCRENVILNWYYFCSTPTAHLLPHFSVALGPGWNQQTFVSPWRYLGNDAHYGMYGTSGRVPAGMLSLLSQWHACAKNSAPRFPQKSAQKPLIIENPVSHHLQKEMPYYTANPGSNVMEKKLLVCKVIYFFKLKM